MTKRIDEEKFVGVCASSKTMSEACSRLGLHFNTFKRWAEKLGCYQPNPGGKGTSKAWMKSDIKTSDILEGKRPSYQTYKLKQRILKEGIKEDKCDICGLFGEWNGKPIHMELEHIDGNRTNHRIGNLMMICPNCHSQTETYRARNKCPSGEKANATDGGKRKGAIEFESQISTN